MREKRKKRFQRAYGPGDLIRAGNRAFYLQKHQNNNLLPRNIALINLPGEKDRFSTKYFEEETKISSLVYKKTPEELKEALENNKDLINQQDEYGKTLLHYAIQAGANDLFTRTKLEPIINLLLEYNPDLGIQDDDGNTPVHIAAQTYGSHAYVFEAVVKHAVEKGYDFTTQNNQGQDIIRSIVTDTRSQSFCAQHIAVLATHEKKLLESTDENGRTPLIFAALHGNIPAVKALIAAGVNIDHQDHIQSTALFYAIKTEPSENKKECARLLVAAGADLTLKDYKDRTVFDVIDGVFVDLPDPRREFFMLLLFNQPLERMDNRHLRGYALYIKNPSKKYAPPSHIPAGADLRGVDFSFVDLSQTVFGEGVLVDGNTNLKETGVQAEELAKCKGIEQLDPEKLDITKEKILHLKELSHSPLEKALQHALILENWEFLRLAIQQNFQIAISQEAENQPAAHTISIRDWYEAFKAQILLPEGKNPTTQYLISNGSRSLLKAFDEELNAYSLQAPSTDREEHLLEKEEQILGKIADIILPLYQLDIDPIKAMATAHSSFIDKTEKTQAATTIQSLVRRHQAENRALKEIHDPENSKLAHGILKRRKERGESWENLIREDKIGKEKTIG